jgi:hypothetical protein
MHGPLTLSPTIQANSRSLQHPVKWTVGVPGTRFRNVPGLPSIIVQIPTNLWLEQTHTRQVPVARG